MIGKMISREELTLYPSLEKRGTCYPFSFYEKGLGDEYNN
jgi:hypothetical protein